MKRWLAFIAMVVIGGGAYGMEEEASEKMMVVSPRFGERIGSIPPSHKRCRSLRKLTFDVCLLSLDKEEDLPENLPQELKERFRAKMIRKKGNVWQQWWDLSPEDRSKEENIDVWRRLGKKEFFDIYDILQETKGENWKKLGVPLYLSPVKPAVQIWTDYLEKKGHTSILIEKELLDGCLKEKGYSLRRFLEELGVSTACLPAKETGLPAEEPGLPAEGLNMQVLFKNLSIYLAESNSSYFDKCCKEHHITSKELQKRGQDGIAPLLELLKPVQRLSVSISQEDLYLKKLFMDGYIKEIIFRLPLRRLQLKDKSYFCFSPKGKFYKETDGFEFLITQMLQNQSLNLKELILDETLEPKFGVPVDEIIGYLQEKVFENLEKLSLSRNKLKNKHIKFFLKALEDNNFLPKLKVLDLSHNNKITFKSIGPLMECLSGRSCFQKLILKECFFSSSEEFLMLPENFKICSDLEDLKAWNAERSKRDEGGFSEENMIPISQELFEKWALGNGL